MHGIVANVSYRNAIRLAMSNIDDIVARCRDCDQFELRQAPQCFGPQRYLVGDRNSRITQAFRQFVPRRDRVFLPGVLESGTSYLRLQCGTIQKYNAMRHTGTRMAVVVLCITPVWIRSSGPRRTALPG